LPSIGASFTGGQTTPGEKALPLPSYRIPFYTARGQDGGPMYFGVFWDILYSEITCCWADCIWQHLLVSSIELRARFARLFALGCYGISLVAVPTGRQAATGRARRWSVVKSSGARRSACRA
jgi:hypothetical protein